MLRPQANTYRVPAGLTTVCPSFAGQAYGNAVGVVTAEELEEEIDEAMVDDDTGESEDDMVIETNDEDEDTTFEDRVVDWSLIMVDDVEPSELEVGEDNISIEDDAGEDFAEGDTGDDA